MTTQASVRTESDPTADWEALARSAPRSLDATDPVADRRELLVIGLADGAYAIPVERVREIVRLTTITRMPRVPDWLLGVVALRGEVVEVVDLRRRLGLPGGERTRASRIVVIHGDEEGIVGMLVDSVKGVIRAPESDVLTAQGFDFRSVVELVRSGDGFVGILDLERVAGLGDA